LLNTCKKDFISLIYKNLIKFFRLPGNERYALARASLALLGAIVSLRLLGVHRTLHWAGRAPQSSAASRRRSIDPSFEKRAVDPAAAAIRAGTCLSKSLALQLLLRRRGVGSRLRLGIRRRHGAELLAHAWLETNGVAVGEPPDPDCTALPVLTVPRTT